MNLLNTKRSRHIPVWIAAHSAGLSNGDSNQSWEDIVFCIYLNADGTVYINEGANGRGNFCSYATGDVFRVAIESGVVKYKKNGTVFYTSTVAPTYPLLVDTSLYTNGSTLTNVVISSAGGSTSVNINWLITDQLGTPRMVFDKSGSLATVKRHDYAPFGEELLNGARTTALGYGASDGVRQKFTSYERDSESGLDYAHARYYSSTQGRFTGADLPLMDQYKTNPQSWNLYIYVGNKPLTYTDPFGLWKQGKCEGGATQCWEAEKGDTISSLANKLHLSGKELTAFFQNPTVAIGQVFDVSGFSGNNTPVAQAQPTYLEVIVWNQSAKHVAGIFGHVSYNINGQSWSWERGGWTAAGETEQRLYLLNAWREAPFYTERERAALAWTEALTLISENHVPDEVYNQARQHFSEQELVDVSLVVVAINGWNRLAISFRAEAGDYQPAKATATTTSA